MEIIILVLIAYAIYQFIAIKNLKYRLYILDCRIGTIEANRAIDRHIARSNGVVL
jgi:hypothetical protein